MPQDFLQIKERLTEISEAVRDTELPLEDALDLYEEAVKLASCVGDTVEKDVFADAVPAAEGGVAPAAQDTQAAAAGQE